MKQTSTLAAADPAFNTQSPMRVTAAFARFDSWFKRDGHWIYESREKALEVWETRGIEGLPSYPHPASSMSMLELCTGISKAAERIVSTVRK